MALTASVKSKIDRYAEKVAIAPGMKAAEVDSDSRTVSGFYNTFNFLDHDGDVLLPGCAKRSIKNNGPKSSAVCKIKHAMHHDLTRLPGKIVTLEERTVNGMSGIYFETQMSETELGNETLQLYKDGVYDNHSIGFRYLDVEMIERGSARWDKIVSQLVNPEAADERNYIWVVKEIQMYEGSTVAYGANSCTPFLGMAKSMTKDSIVEKFEQRIAQLHETLGEITDSSEEAKQMFMLQSKLLRQMIADLADYVTFPDLREEAAKNSNREDDEQEKKKEKGPDTAPKTVKLNLANFSL